MQRARDELKPKAPPSAQPASAAVDNCWSRDRTAPSSLSADTGTPVRGGTASRKNPINPRPGQSSQAAARVPDGKTQSVAKGGHSKEVTALLARIDQLTRWSLAVCDQREGWSLLRAAARLVYTCPLSTGSLPVVGGTTGDVQYFPAARVNPGGGGRGERLRVSRTQM